MKTFNKLLMVVSLFSTFSCSVDDDSSLIVIVPPTPDIKAMELPASMLPTLRYTIQGRGFFVGDTVVLRSAVGNPNTTGEFKTHSVATAFKIDFTVPRGCAGEYDFILYRNAQMYDLDTKLVIDEDFAVADVEMRSQHIRKQGRITITSPDFMSGDSVVISKINSKVRIPTNFNDLGAKKTLTFNLPENFDDGVLIDDEVDISIYRVTLTSFATSAIVHQELTYTVGDLLGGGVVFANDEMTLDAFVVSMNYSSNMPWGEVHRPELEVKTTRSEVGTGAANTKAIVDKQGDWNGGRYAAKYCDDYSVTADGVLYDDWFMPSKDEGILLYSSCTEINSILESNGGAPLGANTTHFWTSTENSFNFVIVMLKDMTPPAYEIGKNFGDGTGRPVRVHKYIH